MLKVTSAVGARPNFIKVAPLMEAMRRREQEFAPLLVHTGQHYDKMMSDAFLRDLDLPQPDVSLEVGSASHAAQTAAIMQKFEPVLLREKPDWVVVVGDVNSTLACALVAAAGSKCARGSRSCSRDRRCEEINRVLTDQIAIRCSRLSGCRRKPEREGIPDNRSAGGNIMIDSLVKYLARARDTEIRERLGVSDVDYAVLTLHRPSNVDDRSAFSRILHALKEIAGRLPVIFPVHPRTHKTIVDLELAQRLEEISSLRLISPLGYLDFLGLYSQAKLVLTDSGGLQEETTFLGIPCLTLRENTERPITVDSGTNAIVGTNPRRITEAAFKALDGTVTATR